MSTPEQALQDMLNSLNIRYENGVLESHIPITRVPILEAVALELDQVIPKAECSVIEMAAAARVELISEDEIFYPSEKKRSLKEEDDYIRVYGSDDKGLVKASIIDTSPKIDVSDDEVYYAKYPPASSHASTLTYFNVTHCEKNFSAINKREVCVTNTRQDKKHNAFNQVEVVSHPSTVSPTGKNYPRKTSLFFSEPKKEINPEEHQLVVYQRP